MTTFNVRRLAERARSPGGALAIVACSALVLFVSPQRPFAPLRAMLREALRPGQSTALACRQWTSRTVDRLAAARADADELATCRVEIERLRRHNQRLQLGLTLALAGDDRAASDSPAADNAPLILADALRARVLGRQARSFLAHADIIAVGVGAGIERGTIVLDEALVTLDQGSPSGLKQGQLAIAGGCIWGRVVEVGPSTSVVARVDQPGYRDLVQLAQRVEGRLRLGPRGVLEGSGEPLCRVRRIETTTAVSVGDLVVVAGEQGLVSAPLLYGHVVRVEQPAGSAHWDIWMAPAASRDAPDELTVVRTRVGPARLVRDAGGAR